MSYDDDAVSGTTFTLPDAPCGSTFSITDTSNECNYSLKEASSKILVETVGDYAEPEDKQSYRGSISEEEIDQRMTERLEQLALYENSQSEVSENSMMLNASDDDDLPILNWKEFLEKVRQNQAK